MRPRTHRLRWLVPAIILIEIGLVRTGVLSARTAIVVVLLVEAALAALMLGAAISVVRSYRAGRARGADPWRAAEDALEILLPPRVARLVALEPRLWVSLGRWLLRRHRLTERDFSYHRRSILGAFLILITLTTPVEVLLFEILIPWRWLRWGLLVAAIYGLLWLYGLYASLVVLPHRAGPRHLDVRYGHLNQATVPYTVIGSVRAERRKAPGGGDGLRVSAQEGTAYLAVGGRTDVTLTLREPVQIAALLSSPPPVTTLCIAADQPERLVAALEQEIERETIRDHDLLNA